MKLIFFPRYKLMKKGPGYSAPILSTLSHLLPVLPILALSGCFSNSSTTVKQPAGSQTLETHLSGAISNSLVRKSEIRAFNYDKPSIAPDEKVSAAIQVAITVDRDALLGQEFLYGADLQYSSAYTAQLDLYLQSTAMGHIPARFRIVGDELQLVSDSKRLYASVVNHPEQLLSRYKILARSEAIAATETRAAKPATLTLSGANSGLLLSELFAGATVGTLRGSLTNPEAGAPPRDLWIRSFDYIPDGNYLLQQTSVVMADGTIAEFMESVFPRSTLNPGKDFDAFDIEPKEPKISVNQTSERYLMLAGEKNFRGEIATSFAQHFDISQAADGSGGTIDFYVTRNIPDEYLEPVQTAIEGWNRYFLQMKGVGRPVMQFKGRLPEGIHLGDPRFNVVNWDSREAAGAAFESQASDPTTGRQSHSLIYMPAAWLFIGNKYWKSGQYSDSQAPKLESVSPQALAKIGGPFQAARVACLRDISEITEILSSGRLSEDEVGIFGVQLLKQTLFHEVGHAIGLGHNFKGSLNYVPGEPHILFSTSIMDYNDFEVEREVFDDIYSWDGPLLEYDRQIMSVLYNHGKDVLDTDPVLPACSDEDADNELGGVDPLCNRYDLENDPTHSINTALGRIINTRLKSDISLAQALNRVGEALTTPTAVQAIRTREDLKKFFIQLADSLRGSMQFYFIGGKTSLAKVVTLNIKSLLMFEPDVLPLSYQEAEMRMRAFLGLQLAANFSSLPEAVTQALDEVTMKAIRELKKSAPFFKSIKQDELIAVLTSFDELRKQIGPAFENDPVRGLPNMRLSILMALQRHPRVPFYLGNLGKDHVDFETAIIGLLNSAILDKSRSSSERIYAAVSLVSFKGRIAAGDKTIQRTRGAITLERNRAQTNPEREVSELILAVLRHP